MPDDAEKLARSHQAPGDGTSWAQARSFASRQIHVEVSEFARFQDFVSETHTEIEQALERSLGEMNAKQLRVIYREALLKAWYLNRGVTQNPPVQYRASLLLDMLVPANRAEDMQANLSELFPRWVERHGTRRARWICRIQVVLLIGGTWWEKAIVTAERLLKVFRLIGS
ncbi:hypothetical protein FIM10_03975 [Sphingomonadales bacterium 56]|uniref:hypothetical protein n=1 Tax=unclassified Sphingobium TaxID=2611147 RepID=UPI001919ED78|nr:MULTISPECIES: hypothetical protein [unclassified Sphingobium]MBY2927833.1 hypothetical protein [Sphingomonadales bacterium 56]MBY2957933.1 hypothetical protein [Sphingomonadales bacterium 58]CAD7336026.1 hypothetical protein SPHS6_00804 [Sphingobium sp. S6]CAD7336089.1 hypothetical protein SPHS8_00844 [Sphingobium sp. S8]